MKKNIIADSDALCSYEDVMPWSRSGGETYCASFKITTESFVKHIVLKAVISFNSEKSLLDWARRKNILSDNEIPVSNWYHYSSGLILEDYYPKSVIGFVSLKKIVPIAKKLDMLGFYTLNFLNDIRSDEIGNPFYIDFGFDLGEPSDTINESAKNQLLKRFVEKKYDILKLYDEK